MQKTIVNTQTVRSFFNANPDLTPENDKTVGPTSAGRGRVSAVARKVYFDANPSHEFAEGKTAPSKAKRVTVAYRHAQPSGRTVGKTVDLTLAEIRDLAGDKAAARGRLTDAAIEAAGVEYAKRAAKAAKATQSKAAKAATPKAVVQESVES